jgi:hypothetical protein
MFGLKMEKAMRTLNLRVNSLNIGGVNCIPWEKFFINKDFDDWNKINWIK